MNTDIRLLLIGAGRAGMIHARNYLNRVPGARITAVSDTNTECAKSAAAELGVSQIFSDYQTALAEAEADAVIVVTPTKYHHDIVIAAAEAGKHIFCEKPMAMNVQECNEMIAAARKNGVKLQIGFMRRFDKNFVRAREIIS